ncbi:MAG: hypothetical protein HOC23_01710 [Halieaceae bacterium]|mgnify:CR=1 FL=1|jgi:hypothetical protein|nr:hypothetical protein [Halieaceae bacterium]
MDSPDTTVVIPSCNRGALLAQTLACLAPHIIRHNMPVLIGENCKCTRDLKKTVETLARFYDLDNVRLLNLTDPGFPEPSATNQLRAIDLLYAQVSTPYIFHCEDDWWLDEYDFITPSKHILKAHPEVTIVRITGDKYRPLADRSSDQTIIRPGVPNISFCYSNYGGPAGLYGAFTFHPGLRRTADYITYYKPYARFAGEFDISAYGQTLRHREALLEQAYAQHIGFDQSVMSKPKLEA